MKSLFCLHKWSWSNENKLSESILTDYGLKTFNLKTRTCEKCKTWESSLVDKWNRPISYYYENLDYISDPTNKEEVNWRKFENRIGICLWVFLSTIIAVLWYFGVANETFTYIFFGIFFVAPAIVSIIMITLVGILAILFIGIKYVLERNLWR